jgi:raffinose/stachyose/melibiose transport system permease protein
VKLVESRATLTITYVVLFVALFVALFPIALLVLNSLKPAAQIVQNPLALPEVIRWDNFARAWKDAKFSQTFFNSVVLTGLTIILVCSTASLTAYVLARRKIQS